MANKSFGSEFLLLQFSEIRELQILQAFLFVVIYLATVTGNLLIVSAITFDHQLHSPMYLDMQDLGSVSVIIPKSIANSVLNTQHISYSGCAAQAILFLFFIASNFFLLTVMAYDRYVAICNPLQYEMVMNRKACMEMIANVCIIGLLFGILHTTSTFLTPFCSNVVNQFFCEIPQLLKLTCTGVNLIETGAVVFCIVIFLCCFIFVIVTNVHTFTAVLRIPSVQGRRKAFSTCLPHLLVFTTLMVTRLFGTLSPILKKSSNVDFLLAVMYSMIPPLLNPVIYGMRNRHVKIALKKLLGLRHSSKETFINLLL